MSRALRLRRCVSASEKQGHASIRKVFSATGGSTLPAPNFRVYIPPYGHQIAPSLRPFSTGRPSSPSNPSHSSPPVLRSSNDSSPETARPNDNTEFISEHHVDPRALFPWRHSPSPLPRLIKGTLEYREQGGYIGPGMPPLNRWIRGALYWNAATMLNIPSYQVLLFHGWKEELETQFSWAFSMAVSGLLSNTYRIPMHEIISNETGEEDSMAPLPFAVNFDQTVEPLPHPTDITEEMPSKPDDDYDEESAPELEYMMQEQLRSLYETAHEHTRHNLQIKLQTEPVSAEIVSFFLIPFLTRERVKATPALRHSFKNVWKHLEDKEDKLGRRLGLGEIISEIAGELETMAKKQADSDGNVESTLIAQVEVRCNEIFKVTDVELGQVVQGDPDGKINEVTHLLRFEMVIRANIDGGPSSLGSWQITDIDDLMDGNIWFT